MGLALDIIIALIIIVTVISCTKKGFVKSVMGLVSVIAACIIAYYLTPVLSPVINEKFVADKITDSVAEKISDVSNNVSGDGFNLQKAFDNADENGLADLLASFGLTVDDVSSVFKTQTNASDETVSEVSGSIAEGIANTISNVISFIIIFLGALIVLGIITLILNALCKLPVLHGANRLLGFIFGCLCAFIYSWLIAKLSVVIIGALSAVNPGVFHTDVAEGTTLLKFFYGVDLFGIVKTLM